MYIRGMTWLVTSEACVALRNVERVSVKFVSNEELHGTKGVFAVVVNGDVVCSRCETHMDANRRMRSLIQDIRHAAENRLDIHVASADRATWEFKKPRD